jgi:hypothetical protein
MPPRTFRPLLTTGLCAALAGCATPPPDEPAEEAPLDTADFAEKAGTLSCVARRDTGYESGRSFSIEVVTVDGKPVERETAEAYWRVGNIIDIRGGRGGGCKPLPHADSFFRLGTFLVAGRSATPATRQERSPPYRRAIPM